MSRNYKFHNQEFPYFVTFTVVKWIDVFTRIEYRDILVESLKYCIKNKGLKLYAWVIMSNHVHLIIGTNDKPMQDILRDIKRHTSKTILKAIQGNLQESRRDGCFGSLNAKAEIIQATSIFNFGRQGTIL